MPLAFMKSKLPTKATIAKMKREDRIKAEVAAATELGITMSLPAPGGENFRSQRRLRRYASLPASKRPTREEERANDLDFDTGASRGSVFSIPPSMGIDSAMLNGIARVNADRLTPNNLDAVLPGLMQPLSVLHAAGIADRKTAKIHSEISKAVFGKKALKAMTKKNHNGGVED